MKKKQGSLRIIFLARIHRSKNLAYAIERVLGLEGDITFDIYGPLEHEDYWQTCRALMEKAPDHIRIRYCGSVPVGKAGETFSRYDCFLFPTLSENYGQVIAEAIQAGTLPVISRATTPWDDLEGGKAIPLAQPEAFTGELQALCQMDESQFAQKRKLLHQYAQRKLNIKELTDRSKALFAAAVEGESP